MVRSLSSALAAVLLAGCSAFGIRDGYEQPSYEVVGQLDGDVEIRRYEPRLAASVVVPATEDEAARNEAFQILAGYIFGGNQSATEIAMTAPVAVEADSAPEGDRIAMTAPVETASAGPGRYAMRFFLPSSLTLETAPVPTDDRVVLETLPAQTVAARRFSGSRDEQRLSTEKERLQRALAGSSWRAAEGAAPVAYLYDPPWTLPFLRRNEVAVAVTPG